ncbi:hypothetical protein CEP54_001830 [Fusarium duplospermum]|uniref:Uncharacterized protein n=1 Tax=Fusarium duplospermum TaxID=1325734 RepID=A0A428QY42_9HYPO|nr:hypothetical protein CEP54_001830 [Fusarium duplospermum]
MRLISIGTDKGGHHLGSEEIERSLTGSRLEGLAAPVKTRETHVCYWMFSSHRGLVTDSPRLIAIARGSLEQIPAEKKRHNLIRRSLICSSHDITMVCPTYDCCRISTHRPPEAPRP